MTDVEVCVVGGGIVGASTAYHLSREGVATRVFDRWDVGRATAAGAGIIAPMTGSSERDGSWYELAAAAATYYPELVEELHASGHSTSYERTPLLSVAFTADERRSLERTLELIADRRQRYGRPISGSVDVLDPTDAVDSFPFLAEPEAVFRYSDAARIDGGRMTGALIDAARSSGASIDSSTVTSIDVSNGCVEGLKTADGETVTCDTIVIAAGAWSGALCADIGLDIPLIPQRGQIAHFRPQSTTDDWPIVSGYRGHYLVPWPDGRIVAGATRESDAGFESRLTVGGLREVYEEALRVAPGLADAEVLDRRVGLRPLSIDGLPIIGPTAAAEGLVIATGHGPTGLTLGPYTGRIVAQFVRRGSADLSLDPFSPDRRCGD